MYIILCYYIVQLLYLMDNNFVMTKKVYDTKSYQVIQLFYQTVGNCGILTDDCLEYN